MNRLDDLEVYKLAMGFGDHIWKLVKSWSVFEQRTIGIQLVRAADSVAANIAESHGRYHYGERRQFSYYARGSLTESESWLAKCEARRLIPEHEVKELIQDAGQLGRMPNGYIRSIGNVIHPCSIQGQYQLEAQCFMVKLRS